MYYGGDYSRGDYYTGDPGLFSFLGNVARSVVKIGTGAVGGFLTKGLPGAIVGAAAGGAEAVASETRRAVITAGGTQSAYTPAMRAKHAEVVARGGAGYLQRGGMAVGNLGPVMAPVIGPAAATAMVHVRRMHPNRSTYVTRGGGTSRWPVGLMVHVKGTEAVPSRRMNVANPRALRRSIRRLRGFGKIVQHMKRAIARANTAVGNVHRGRSRMSPVRRRR